MPSSEITTGRTGEQDRATGGVHRDDGGAADVVAGVQLFAEPRDDQQRVVDAHAETDHEPDELGRLRQRHDVADGDHERRADADAEEGDPHRQPHREDGPEREDQDDDREREPDHLRRGVRELGEDLTAELDLEPADGRLDVTDRVADLCRFRKADLLRQFDLGERHLPCARAGGREEAAAFRAVRADHPVDVLEPGHVREQCLHLRLDRGVLDPLVCAEHDPAGDAGALAAEVAVEDVEAVLRVGGR
jgi:hypothetical protein